MVRRRGIGKLLRKKGSSFLPWAVMSFWTILSCCFSTQSVSEDNIRPRGLVQLNNEPVSALFDTGSVISLVDAKFLQLIKYGQPKEPSIQLCRANGTPLKNKGVYGIKITVKGKRLCKPSISSKTFKLRVF